MDTKQSVEWRPVVGFENNYEVSSDGEVRSVDHLIEEKVDAMGRTIPPYMLKGKVLQQRKHMFGYWMVTLSVKNVRYDRCVHRLVAEAFLGPRPEGSVIRHLNGNPEDCRACNLAYGTQTENMNDAIQQDTVQYGERRYNAKLDNETVIKIKDDIIAGLRNKDIAEKYRISESKVCKIASGDAWGRVGARLSRPRKIKLLTEEEKQIAFQLREKGMSFVAIGKTLGVSKSQVWNLVKRQENEDCKN